MGYSVWSRKELDFYFLQFKELWLIHRLCAYGSTGYSEVNESE